MEFRKGGINTNNGDFPDNEFLVFSGGWYERCLRRLDLVVQLRQLTAETPFCLPFEKTILEFYRFRFAKASKITRAQTLSEAFLSFPYMELLLS